MQSELSPKCSWLFRPSSCRYHAGLLSDAHDWNAQCIGHCGKEIRSRLGYGIGSAAGVAVTISFNHKVLALIKTGERLSPPGRAKHVSANTHQSNEPTLKIQIIAFRQCSKRLWLEIHNRSCAKILSQPKQVFGSATPWAMSPNGPTPRRETAWKSMRSATAIHGLRAICEATRQSAAACFRGWLAYRGALAFADIMLPDLSDGTLAGGWWRSSPLLASKTTTETTSRCRPTLPKRPE